MHYFHNLDKCSSPYTNSFYNKWETSTFKSVDKRNVVSIQVETTTVEKRKKYISKEKVYFKLY